MAVKAKAAPVAVPQTYDAANAALEEFGANARKLATFETRLGASLARITARIEQNALPLKERQKVLAEQIAGYAAAHRDELLKDDLKSHEMPAGKIGWRLNPASVEVKSGVKVAVIIAAIRKLKLGSLFVRVKLELNREAMLEEKNRKKAASIPNVKIITDAETFYIEPKSAELSKGEQ